MPDYKSMYFKLFNGITDAINLLQKAQRECEEVYIKSNDTPVTMLPKEPSEKQET